MKRAREIGHNPNAWIFGRTYLVLPVATPRNLRFWGSKRFQTRVQMLHDAGFTDVRVHASDVSRVPAGSDDAIAVAAILELVVLHVAAKSGLCHPGGLVCETVHHLAFSATDEETRGADTADSQDDLAVTDMGLVVRHCDSKARRNVAGDPVPGFGREYFVYLRALEVVMTLGCPPARVLELMSTNRCQQPSRRTTAFLAHMLQCVGPKAMTTNSDDAVKGVEDDDIGT